MESLNMNTLASSLPNSANAEKQLMDNFKAAALSITTLYRSSLDTSKRAYSAGYATCLQDVLHFVEAGVSNAGEEMTIGRVMDWIEARLEAIKSTEEEEEEERLKESPVKPAPEDGPKEDKEKRTRKASGSGTVAPRHRRSKENLNDALLPTNTAPLIPSPRPPSSSPPVRARSFASPSPPPPPVTRPIRPRRGLKDLGPSAPFGIDNVLPFTFSPDVVSPLPISIPVAGSKRRHATMITESPASSSVAATSSPIQPGAPNHVHGHNYIYGGGRRKRGRGGRDRDAHHGQNMNGSGNVQTQHDAMDVEEEGGRERKRVARR